MINFYHMEGCPHCVDAMRQLQTQIDSGKINLFSHQEAASKGVRGFPYFELVDANNNVLKTSTGWSGKQNLYTNLGYTEENYDNCQNQNPNQNPNYLEKYQNHFFPNYEKFDSFPVVEHMETFPPEVLYNHHTGCGYSKLNNCWVKQSPYTA